MALLTEIGDWFNKTFQPNQIKSPVATQKPQQQSFLDRVKQVIGQGYNAIQQNQIKQVQQNAEGLRNWTMFGDQLTNIIPGARDFKSNVSSFIQNPTKPLYAPGSSPSQIMFQGAKQGLTSGVKDTWNLVKTYPSFLTSAAATPILSVSQMVGGPSKVNLGPLGQQSSFQEQYKGYQQAGYNKTFSVAIPIFQELMAIAGVKGTINVVKKFFPEEGKILPGQPQLKGSPEKLKFEEAEIVEPKYLKGPIKESDMFIQSMSKKELLKVPEKLKPEFSKLDNMGLAKGKDWHMVMGRSLEGINRGELKIVGEANIQVLDKLKTTIIPNTYTPLPLQRNTGTPKVDYNAIYPIPPTPTPVGTPQLPVQGGVSKDFLQQRLEALKTTGGTIKTPEELALQYPKTKPFIKITGAPFKQQLVNAFSLQGPKTFDLGKTEAINYILKTLGENRVKQIFRESGLNNGATNSITKFWNIAKRELDVKKPNWRTTEQWANESLISGIPEIKKSVIPKVETIKVEEPRVTVNPKVPLDQDIKSLELYPSKDVVTKETAPQVYKDFTTHANNIIDRMAKGIKYYNLTQDQWIKYIENPPSAPENVRSLLKSHINLMETLHKMWEMQNLGKIEHYIPHYSQDYLNIPGGFKNLGKNIWVSDFTVNLPSTKTRTGKLVNYSTDYKAVMQEYIKQLAYKKYGKKIEFTPEKIEFIRKIEEHNKPINTDGELTGPSSDFDYVKESSVSQKIENKPAIHSQMLTIDTFDSLRRKISADKNGSRLSGVMRSVRDMNDGIDGVIIKLEESNTNQKIDYLVNNLTFVPKNINLRKNLLEFTEGGKKELPWTLINSLLKGERDFRIQNLIDEVGKYDFPPVTKDYLNFEIDRLLKQSKYEQSLLDKVANFATGTFYRAQVWGNISTAITQKGESARIPVFYSPEVIKSGIKQFATDIKNREDILKRYDFTYIETDISKQLGYQKKESLLKIIDEKSSKVGNFMVTVAENSKNRDFLYAAEAQGKLAGLKGKDLYNFVRDELFANGFILHEFNTPDMLKNPLVRFALQYQQYNVKLFNRALELASFKQKGKIIGLLGSQMVAAILIGIITGKSLEYIKNRIFGVQAGPGISLLYQTSTYLKDVYDARKKQEEEGISSKQTEEYVSNQLKNLTLRNTIPFANQYYKTKGALDTLNKGYDETYSGRITYTAPESKLEQAQGLMFGETSFSGNKEYYAEKDKKGYYSIGGQPGSYGDKIMTKIKNQFTSGDKEGGRESIKIQRNIQETRKASYEGLNAKEKGAYDSFPTYEPDNPQYNLWKYSTYIQYPAVFNAKRDMAIANANGDLTKIDPLFLTPNWQVYAKGQKLQASAYNSEEYRQYVKNHPEYTEIAKARSDYFKLNPIDSESSSEYPTPSERVQTLLSQKNYNDPEVQNYFNKRLEYINKMRVKQGLDPQDSYGNILGSATYGSSGYSKWTKWPKKPKKVAFKKISTKKIKISNIKAKKPLKIKKIKTPKLSKIKIKTLTKGKNKLNIKIKA